MYYIINYGRALQELEIAKAGVQVFLLSLLKVKLTDIYNDLSKKPQENM